MKNCSLLAGFLFLVLPASAQLIIEPGAVLNLTGNTKMVLYNLDLVNRGAIFMTANGRFTFAGSSDNGIISEQPLQFVELEIAKTGSGKISLQQAINIQGKIVFTGGLIDLNRNNILLGPTAFLENENENSRITGATGGELVFTTMLNAPAAINPANMGIVITSPKNLGNVTIRRGHQSQINGAGGGNSIFRYYEMTAANNTAPDAILRLHYFDAELNGLTENNLVLWKSPDNARWIDQGFTSRATNTNFVEKTGITDLPRFTLSSPGNALPLVWGSFLLKCVNDAVVVQWKTLQEYNTRTFLVQRSHNGYQWTTAGTLPAAGYSHTTLDYHFADAQSDAFYRIIQTDMDGRQTISPILLSQCAGKEIFEVYPNPVRTELVVGLSAQQNETVLFRIFDTKGSLVQQQNGNLQRGMNQVVINVALLPPGTYHLLVRWPSGKQQTVKLGKQ